MNKRNVLQHLHNEWLIYGFPMICWTITRLFHLWKRWVFCDVFRRIPECETIESENIEEKKKRSNVQFSDRRMDEWKGRKRVESLPSSSYLFYSRLFASYSSICHSRVIFWKKKVKKKKKHFFFLAGSICLYCRLPDGSHKTRVSIDCVSNARRMPKNLKRFLGSV